MCKNHAARHIDPLIVAFCEQVVRSRDRGSEENVAHILGETLSTLMWAGLSDYLYNVVKDHDEQLFVQGEALCFNAFRRNKAAMDRWAADHPEAHVGTVTVDTTVLSIRTRE